VVVTHVPLVAWTPTAGDARTPAPRRSCAVSSPARLPPTRAPASTGTKGPDRVWRAEDPDSVATSETVWAWPEPARWSRVAGSGTSVTGTAGELPMAPSSPSRVLNAAGLDAGTRPSRPAVGGASPSGTTSANRSAWLVDDGSLYTR
jgi:hypothetical protein